MTSSGPRASPTEPPPAGASSATSDADTLVGDATVAGEGMAPRPGRAGSSDALPLSRGDTVGRYLLLELLGRGAMGRVFAAYDPDLDRRVAIKVVDASSDQQLQEAKVMARIDHPNVIRVYDVGRHDSTMFIAMELVEGITLEQWTDRPRTRPEILDALIGAARGLAAAHAAGVVHRDFKPANVMMTAADEPKVGDFGLAGLEQGEADGPGHVVGTPAYMSPEHFAGTGVNAASDQFSFAIVLAEALHGSRPFHGQTVPELAAKVVSGELAPEHTSGRGRLDAIVRRALSPAPRDRFDSMDDVVLALERVRRPVWSWWVLAVGLVAAITTALAWGTAEEPSPCEAGSERVEAIWTPAARDAIQLRAPTFTDAHLHEIRERFERAIDDYAVRWSAAHDRSCAVAGPGGARGTPAQAATAQCLENRLGSLRGLIEFSTADPLDASRADDLLETLPSLDDCTSGRWVPYPADPDRASEAAAIDEQVAAIARSRNAHRLEVLDEMSKATVETARALGEPHPLARALKERARVFTDLQRLPQARALLDEALEVALLAGHDRLAADIVNSTLIAMSKEPEPSWTEARHLGALARGLVGQHGEDDELLGFATMNIGRVYQELRRHDEALAHFRRAIEYLERTGNQIAVARARLNMLTSLTYNGRIEETTALYEDVAVEIEQTLGVASPLAISARRNQYTSLTLLGRTREAYERSLAQLELIRANFAPTADTYERTLNNAFVHALTVGDLDAAARMRDELREISADDPRWQPYYQVLFLNLPMDRGELDGLEPQLIAAAERAEALEDQALWWHARIDLARLYIVQGRREAAAEIVADPRLGDLLEHSTLTAESRVTTLLVAVLSGATPPPEGWEARLLPEGVSYPISRPSVAAARAIASEGPVDEVRRQRDELARLYHPGNFNVRLLDTWLASTPAP